MKEKLMRFMMGRYGTDRLNQDMLILSAVLMFLGILTPWRWIQWIGVVIIFVLYFRMFSKNINQRYRENQRYLYYRNKVVQRFKRLKDLPRYKYVACSQCHQQLRLPRRKGNVVVTCPKCRHQFDART